MKSKQDQDENDRDLVDDDEEETIHLGTVEDVTHLYTKKDEL